MLPVFPGQVHDCSQCIRACSPRLLRCGNHAHTCACSPDFGYTCMFLLLLLPSVISRVHRFGCDADDNKEVRALVRRCLELWASVCRCLEVRANKNRCFGILRGILECVRRCLEVCTPVHQLVFCGSCACLQVCKPVRSYAQVYADV